MLVKKIIMFFFEKISGIFGPPISRTNRTEVVYRRSLDSSGLYKYYRPYAAIDARNSFEILPPLSTNKHSISYIPIRFGK